MPTQASLDKVQELFIAYYGRPADLAGQTYWADELEASSLEAIINRFATSAEFDEQYGELTNQQLIAELYKQILDRDPADTPDDEGPAWYAEQLSEGLMTRGEIALAILAGATGDDALVLQNRKAVADEFTQAVEDANKVYNVEAGKALLATVGADTDPATVDVAGAVAALPDVEEPTEPGEGDSLTLTQRADALTGTDGDDIFEAPVTQNETGSGALANTFETGDELIGGEGNDVLRADLIGSGSISDNVAAPAISATTTGIEEVYFRAQTPNSDAQVNLNTIDAQNMSGVEQWWSDNSRSNITIEDIRSATEDTTFGMRLTDPGVAFTNYFNALFLEGQVDDGASSFTFVISETNDAAAELANINVFAINFEHNGVNYSLDSDAVRDADTWAELQTALQAEIDAEAALEGLTVTHNGGGNFVVTDPAAGIFDIDPSGTVVTSSTTLETKDAVLGRLDPEEGPTVTNVVLDGAGNGSQGGALNIGAMSGLRGVEVFEVNVDRDSHLTSMTSFNATPAQYANKRDGSINEHLEVVNLTSIGAEGDLTIGRTNPNAIDGRTSTWTTTAGVVDNTAGGNSGLVNILELNTDGFNGALNASIALDNNAIDRYLDPATDVVTFSYNGGEQGDILNIADVSTNGVSGDQDFAMEVDMNAGDDRLILTGFTVNAVSVDGGEGENTIVVAQSHGTNTANTFAGFENFQTYEVEGTGNNTANNTTHDFTSMAGVENVVIATDGNTPVLGLPTVGDNTTLIDLEADQNVTISGKNQTVGNNSTEDQIFGTITLTDDAGAERTVTLDNTARLSNAATGTADQDGILTVNNLIMNTGTGTSATRDVIIDSAGERNVANAVLSFSGRDVETLQLTGTQELTFNVNQIADQATAAGVNASTALDIDASELEGDLNLAIDGSQIGNWGNASNLVDNIIGTEGDNDTLMVYSAQGNSPVTVTGFETIQFGSANNTMFGDLNIGPLDADDGIGGTGIFDAQNVAASSFVIADDIAVNTALVLNNLGNGVTVTMGDANRDVAGNIVNSQIFDDFITLNSGAAAGVPAAELNVDYLSNLLGGTGPAGTIQTLTVAGYQSINIDIAHAGNLTGVGLAADDRTLNLTLDADARVLDISGGLDHFATTAAYDTLTLGNALANSLTTVDFSDYVGQIGSVTLNAAAVAADQSNTTIVMNGYDANVFDNVIAQITTFRFTEDAVAATEDWTITGFRAFNDNVGTNGLTNLSVLDMRDLGVQGLADITIVQSATDGTDGNTTAADTVTITSNQGLDFEITLVGVEVGELSNENFAFAI
jgi:hypothetical protein